MPDRDTVPRGRHAPPLEVRQDRQLQRLSEAAAVVFARLGYADATAEAIAREAGMSKATFYEHFANKEDCILALFDRAMARILGAMQGVGAAQADLEPRERYRQSIQAMLAVFSEYTDYAQTLLIEIIGAGPKAMERRDTVFGAIASYIYERNRPTPTRASRREWPRPMTRTRSWAATVELASRQIRTGVPAQIADLEPVIDRLIRGILLAADGAPAAAWT